MEISQLIETIERLQNDLQSVALSTIEKDILLKKIAVLYENLVATKPTNAISQATFSIEKTAIKEQQKPVAEIIEVNTTNAVIVEEKAIVAAEETKPIVPETKTSITATEQHQIPQLESEKTAKNADFSTLEETKEREEEEKTSVKTTHSLLDLKAEKSSLNERFQQHTVSLNERVQQDDLRKALDFNRTILFTTELFGKDSVAFGKAIDRLNASKSIEEAFAYLNNEVIHQYKWKPESQSVKLFEKIVRQKFGLQ